MNTKNILNEMLNLVLRDKGILLITVQIQNEEKSYIGKLHNFDDVGLILEPIKIFSGIEKHIPPELAYLTIIAKTYFPLTTITKIIDLNNPEQIKNYMEVIQYYEKLQNSEKSNY